jgi:glycosyl transferase family 87
VELRDRARRRLSRAFLLALALALLAPAGAAASTLRQPPSQTQPPRFYKLSARQAIAIADRASKVRAERRHGRLAPTAYENGVGRWQVSYFRRGGEAVQVQVDDRSKAILEQWRGPQIAWTMARGYPGAFGRKLNAPYVWLPLCLLFLVPFLDPRRPFRLLHLDLLVILGFGISHVFFNQGEIGVSVPLVYPVLLYLIVRALAAGFRPRARAGPLVPWFRPTWLAVGLVFLVAFRVGLDVVDSNVIDVGYAGVVGADRIADGDSLYGPGFASDLEHGDTYGPVSYLTYVPFEQALPWSGSWDDLPAARGAAIAFDLGTLLVLLALGRRLRAGREGRVLGLALAWGWAACPYSAFALESNSNDSLVALGCVGALLAANLARDYAAGLWTGVALGLASATKFVTLALAPLFARREPAVFALALLLVLVATVAPFVPDGGLQELYDRTIGYQTSRPSPFSIWGQVDSLGWLQTLLKGAAGGLALLVARVPRRIDLRQTAALGAGVLIAIQLVATHWFYLYVVWFVPFVLVAMFAAHRSVLREPAPESQVEREPVFA